MTTSENLVLASTVVGAGSALVSATGGLMLWRATLEGVAVSQGAFLPRLSVEALSSPAGLFRVKNAASLRVFVHSISLGLDAVDEEGGGGARMAARLHKPRGPFPIHPASSLTFAPKAEIPKGRKASKAYVLVSACGHRRRAEDFDFEVNYPNFTDHQKQS